MAERGAFEVEVIETIRTGEQVPAKLGRQGFRKNFEYNQVCRGRTFAIKQVLAIVTVEIDAIVVVTIYTFYF